jgi:hypothetical protein
VLLILTCLAGVVLVAFNALALVLFLALALSKPGDLDPEKPNEAPRWMSWIFGHRRDLTAYLKENVPQADVEQWVWGRWDINAQPRIYGFDFARGGRRRMRVRLYKEHSTERPQLKCELLKGFSG